MSAERHAITGGGCRSFESCRQLQSFVAAECIVEAANLVFVATNSDKHSQKLHLSNCGSHIAAHVMTANDEKDSRNRWPSFFAATRHFFLHVDTRCEGRKSFCFNNHGPA